MDGKTNSNPLTKGEEGWEYLYGRDAQEKKDFLARYAAALTRRSLLVSMLHDADVELRKLRYEAGMG